MGLFKCKHVPLPGASKEPRLVNLKYCLGWFFGEPNFSKYTYRALLTEHVCMQCGAHYSTTHKIDETSAKIGPEPEPGPPKVY